jgi:hypothetical protein
MSLTWTQTTSANIAPTPHNQDQLFHYLQLFAVGWVVRNRSEFERVPALLQRVAVVQGRNVSKTRFRREGGEAAMRGTARGQLIYFMRPNAMADRFRWLGSVFDSNRLDCTRAFHSRSRLDAYRRHQPRGRDVHSRA